MDPKALETEAQSAIAGAENLADLESARVRFLGRRSELAQALRAVRDRESGMVLNTLRDRLEEAGLRFCGMSPDGLLPEIVELPGHPWFIGVQFHPELKSRPFEPHPLFASFIAAAVEQSRLV